MCTCQQPMTRSVHMSTVHTCASRGTAVRHRVPPAAASQRGRRASPACRHCSSQARPWPPPGARPQVPLPAPALCGTAGSPCSTQVVSVGLVLCTCCVPGPPQHAPSPATGCYPFNGRGAAGWPAKHAGHSASGLTSLGLSEARPVGMPRQGSCLPTTPVAVHQPGRHRAPSGRRGKTPT